MNAQLHIQTATRDGITYLGQTYFTPPFKVANITEDKRSAWLHLMIMNSSPGVLDGDQYEIKIDVSENASLQLHTQSYQRLFHMKTGATQLLEVHLQKDSSFVYLPHPTVPHEQSIFTTRNKIFLNDSRSLLWGEVMTCGRKLSKGIHPESGEVFKFSKYHAVTEIFSNNKLIIKENLLIEPSITDPTGMGQLEGYTHQASLISLDANRIGNECQEEICDYLSQQTDILSGVSTTASNGMIVRILGYGAEQLYRHLQSIAFLLQQQKEKTPSPAIYAN